MNTATRYISVKAIQYKGVLELATNWAYQKHEEGLPRYVRRTDGAYTNASAIDAVWDMKNGCIKPFRIKEVKPDTKAENYAFKVGTKVVVEDQVRFNHVHLDEIASIEFEEYESSFNKFDTKDTSMRACFTEEELLEIKDKEIIEFRYWKPIFKLKSGTVVIHSHRMKPLL